MKNLVSKNIYLIFTIIFLVASLFAGVYLVRTNQETRRGATCTTGGGGCGNPDCCRSWEVYQDGCCHSTSGCTQHSDCSDGKLCVNGTCQGAPSPSCDSCNGSETKCSGTTYKYCENSCWKEDPTKNNLCSGAPTGVTTSTPQQNLCNGVADSGCTTGGKGGVDCANCRQTGGQVKQCSGTWYCCYSDGNCYQGTAQTSVVCSGTTITNNSGNTVTGNIYQGCANGNKIGSFSLANGQSKTASNCNQIDIPGFCGVCNSNGCQAAASGTTVVPTNKPASTPTPTTTPKPTSTPVPSKVPSNSPTPTQTPTGTPKPTSTLSPTNSPVPTDTPVSTATPTTALNSTPVPTTTLAPPSYLSPTPSILPLTGVNLPIKSLTIFGTIVTLLGFLVLL